MPDNKVVNTFQQRRQLMQALDALDSAANEAAMIDAAYEIVQAYPSDLILSALVKHLETADSHLRGALGHVAALLPEEETVSALRAAVADRQGVPQKRIAAALILERYLDQAPPPGLMNDLDNSNEVAFQSLVEAIESGKRDRRILLEYITQMRQTEPIVASMVMDMLERIEPADRVDLLRLIAQDDRPPVSEDALARLEALANTGAAPQATRALYTLQPVLPNRSADRIKRTLRRLQFSGTVYHVPQPIGWQALVAPSGPAGLQTVWLVQRPQQVGTSGKVLSLMLNPQSGIHQMFGSEDLAVEHLPPEQPIGEIVSVNAGGGRALNMLATPFDFGRWLILQASIPHLLDGARKPFPEEYQIYNDLLWAYAPPLVDPEVVAYFDRNARADDMLDVEGDAEMLTDVAAELLALPSMNEWARQNILLVDAAASLQDELSRLPGDLVVRHIQRDIASLGESTVFAQALEDGLRAQAAWLHYAGDEFNARRAYLLAKHMQRTSLAKNPLLTQMIRISLQQIPSDGRKI